MKSSHHLLHDRACKGHGSTPGLTSQTDLHWFAISYTAIAHFYLPTVIIFCASWYQGHHKHFSQTVEKRRTSNFFVSLARLGSSSAVWLFMLYGILVVDGIFKGVKTMKSPCLIISVELLALMKMCFFSCLFFQSTWAILLRLKREEKPQQHLEIWKESKGIACSSEWLEWMNEWANEF